MRHNGRAFTEMRPLKFTPDFVKHPAGSVLVETGETKVLCAVTVEDNIPNWLKHTKPPQGWLTAEYSLMPASTRSRARRERPNLSGRTQEIQRLIGRSLRGVIDLRKCPDKTFMIDCDVLQADGGTRTAAITGSYVALRLAVGRLLKAGRLKQDPLTDEVAAVSIGLREGQILVDLDYKEDSSADLDMNVVMTGDSRILEIQGTAERQSFTKTQVVEIMDAAEQGLQPVFAQQRQLIESYFS